jgi:hypothetical protein
MSFPGTYNINYYYGDTLEFRVFPKNSSGEPFNLATFGNAKFTIARNRNTPVADHISCFAQIDPDQTNILCAIRPEDAEKLVANADGSFPTYVYDVEISKPVNGSPYPIVYTLLNGSVTTTRDVTRPGSGAVVPPVISVPLNPTNLVLDSETDATLSVSWTAPTTGDAPTLYTFVAIPFTETLEDLRQAIQNSELPTHDTTSGTTATITGLEADTGYSVIVRSRNSAGEASLETILFNSAAFSTTAEPASVPSAPVINSISELDSSLQVLFTASSDGGSAITNYKYSIDGTSYVSFDPAQTTSPLNISGLTNGSSYPVTIKAVNAVGDSSSSNSVTATPTATVPAAPTISSIDAADESLVVNFTAGGDGGSSITNYKYSIDGTNYTAFDPATTTSPVTITGLTNDTSYPVTIKAVNSIGDSNASNIVSATPVAPAPTPDFAVTNSGASSYLIDGVSNDTITLVRGETYIFDINASGHPFWIQDSPGSYDEYAVYNNGITGNGTQVGTMTWEVSLSAPSTLYYVCQFHSSMQGIINIIDGES